MREPNTRRQFLRMFSLFGVSLVAACTPAPAAAPPTAVPTGAATAAVTVTAPRTPTSAVTVSASGDVLEISSGVAIQNAAIVSTRDGTIAQGMTIVLGAGKIQKVSPIRSVHTSGAAQLVDATGKYVVPGFLDMHTHATATLDHPPSDFPVLLANGVTGIREMSGSPGLIQRARQLNADVLAGRVDAPEVLIMPSDIFTGQQATDAAGAMQFVTQKKADGAAFIKATGGSRQGFLAVLAEAKKQGLPAAGHLTPAVSALESSNAGYHFEHLGAGWGLLLDCASDEDAIRQAALANPAPPPPNVINPRLFDGNWNAPHYQRIIDTFSDSKFEALTQAFIKNGTWQTLTLIRLRTQDYGDDQLYRTDPNLMYIDKTRRALWDGLGQQFAETITPATRATLQQYYALQLKSVKLMKQAGVKMLAASDLGGGWVIPGFSLHQEFRELAAAGLSPLEILQMTTLNGAQFLGREATLGTVEEGKNADLVLLDGNPIADVANLDKISAVVSKGKYYSKAALDKLKSDVAAAYASQSARDPRTALDLLHVH